MNILVCVKPVLCPQELKPAANNGPPVGFFTTNRADECAMELASRLIKKGEGELTLLSVAGDETEEILDFYVGLGADGLIRVWDEELTGADSGAIALVMAEVAKRVDPDLILCGDRAIGSVGSGLMGPLLAELLGWPFLGSVIEADVCSPQELNCSRIVERGDRQIFNVPLPAVVAASPEAQATRYPAYARIQRSRRQLLDLFALGLSREDLDGLLTSHTHSHWTIAKPNPRKLFTPPSTASASDRMRLIMGGGQAPKSQTNLVEGPPGRVAEQIIQFLRQERLI